MKRGPNGLCVDFLKKKIEIITKCLNVNLVLLIIVETYASASDNKTC